MLDTKNQTALIALLEEVGIHNVGDKSALLDGLNEMFMAFVNKKDGNLTFSSKSENVIDAYYYFKKVVEQSNKTLFNKKIKN